MIENLEHQINKLINLIKIDDIEINNCFLNQLLRTTGSIENFNNNFNLMKFKIQYSDDIHETINIMKDIDATSDWKIISFKKSDLASRLELIVANNKNNVKFLLNWKNSYTYKGIKYSAKCGLGTASFNVWNREKNKEI